MKQQLSFIGLCGWPGAGKDEVAAIMQKQYDYQPIDDGLCLRQAIPYLFGFERTLPYTREGKDTVIETVAGPRTVRDLLGTVGGLMENEYGTGFMPHAAMRNAQVQFEQTGQTLFVFSSVRKDQPWHYKEQGGKIIQINRPGVKPSPHPFDAWDEASVDAVIDNNGSLEDLAASVGLILLNINKYEGRRIWTDASCLLRVETAQ